LLRLAYYYPSPPWNLLRWRKLQRAALFRWEAVNEFLTISLKHDRRDPKAWDPVDDYIFGESIRPSFKEGACLEELLSSLLGPSIHGKSHRENRTQRTILAHLFPRCRSQEKWARTDNARAPYLR